MPDSPARDHVVARLFDVFRAHGFDGASLAEISAATGLGKSSLYHHFPGGKREMAIAVLERAEALMRAHVLDPLRKPGTPKRRLHAMMRSLDAFYAGGRLACVLGTFTVGGGRAALHAGLRAAFSAWTEALHALAVEADVPDAEARHRAEDVVVRIEGALVLASALDDPGPFRRALKRAERDLLAPAR